MKIHLFMSTVGLLALAGCNSVGPDYAPPTTDLSATFIEGNGNSVKDLAQSQWWRGLNNAKLNELVERGMGQNLDIKTAFERIRVAEAQLESTGFPSQLSGSASAQTQRSGGSLVPKSTTSAGTINAALVLDLFGGVRRGQQEATANLEATQFDLGTIRLAYLSGIIGNYIDARYFQESLELTRQNIASTQRTFALVRSQRELGAGTDLAVAQAQAELDTARASLPSLESGFYSAVYRIATLLAESASPLLVDLRRGAAQPYPHKSGRVGIPANLLRNRPDVLASERRYAASVAAIGVAEADLYPSVSLSGTVTFATANSWSFGPSLSLPILGREALYARRKAAVSQAKLAELDWRASVLSAVEDVQIAQTTFIRRRREVTALRSAVASNNRALELSRSAFEVDGISVLDLIDAERGTSRTRISLATAVRDATAAWVTLQLATGSGWAAK